MPQLGAKASRQTLRVAEQAARSIAKASFSTPCRIWLFMPVPVVGETIPAGNPSSEAAGLDKKVLNTNSTRRLSARQPPEPAAAAGHKLLAPRNLS
jgi:hypothetical protein